MSRDQSLSYRAQSSGETSSARHEHYFLQGGGAVGGLMRSHQWSDTAFGHPDSWSAPLRSSVGLCLSAPNPTCVYWGPEMRLLYNDAWSSLPGKRHPWAMGRPAQEVWQGHWPAMGPMLEGVFAHGDSNVREDDLFPAGADIADALNLAGDRESDQERYFTHTVTPIRDENGAVFGIFNGLMETTARVLAERRSRALLKLSTVLLSAADQNEAAEESARVLASVAEDVPFVAVYLNEQSTGSLRRRAIAGQWLRDGARPDAAPPTLGSNSHAMPVLPGCTAGKTKGSTLPRGSRLFQFEPDAASGQGRSILLLALRSHEPGNPADGYLLCGLNPRLPLDTAYGDFLASSAFAIGAAVQGIASRAREHQHAEVARLALETGRFGTWTYDLEYGEFELSQQASELFGYPAVARVVTLDALIARYQPQDRQAAAAAFAGLLEQRGRLLFEARVTSAEEDERWLGLRGSFFRNAHGHQRLTGLIIDITERHRAEEVLRETEKLAAAGRLASTVAHEINNPLESVTNLIYLAAMDDSLSPSTAHLLKTADEELGRVTHIAQQTLGFYRDSLGPVQVDAHKLVSDLVRLFERRPDAHSISIDMTAVQHVPLVCMQGELRQILSNLLGNAVQASAPGSRVRIAARLSYNYRLMHPVLRLSIADTGSGIGVEARRRIFTAFFTTKRDIGNGLGLWVSKNMLEKQGGTIRFRSRTGSGSGTCFMITLPTEMSRSTLQ